MDYHRMMTELHSRIAPTERVVGWYSTGNEIDRNAPLLNELYAKECQGDPVLLFVDPNVEKIEIKAYLCETLGSFGEVARIGTAFMPIPFECKSADEEAFEMSLLHKAAVQGNEAPITTDLEALETTLYELQELVNKAQEYVESVLSGKIAGSVEMGVKLMEALSSVPQIDGDNFEKLFQSQLKDILIVLYLANLTKTQLAIAEKLHQAQ